jgi:DNA-binding LacI/PurR family transcriptional regulator
MLLARGVRGILLPPHPNPDIPIDLSWDNFSVVALGSSIARTGFHCTTHDHYRSMQLVMEACRRHGYRRPGFAIERLTNERTDQRFEASFRVARESGHVDCDVPILIMDTWNAGAIKQWVRKEAPDVIISVFTEAHLKLLRQEGVRVPEKIGLISLSVHYHDSPLSGVCQQASLLGAAAMDQLITCIEHGERGVPEHPVTVSLKGAWNVGVTLPDRIN